jgi:hypothetical protein
MRGDGMTSLPIIQFGISVSLEKTRALMQSEGKEEETSTDCKIKGDRGLN